MKKHVFLIVSVIFIIASVFLTLLYPKKSFSIPNGNSVSIYCDRNSIPVGGTASCTIGGSYDSISAFSGYLNATGGLQISDFSFQQDWQGSYSDNLISASHDLMGGSFTVATFIVTGNYGGENSVSLTNCYIDSEVVDSSSFGITVKSTNNNLSSLTVGGTTYQNPNTTYNLTVNSSSVNISAVKADNAATIISGTGSRGLNYGNNRVDVVVRSEAGTTKTYTININRPDNRSSNNNLSSLSLSSGKISFNKATTNYSVDVGSDVESVKISAKIEDSKSSYVNGYNPRTVKLNYGVNTAQIRVIAENGSVKTYTININRVKKSSGSSTNNSASSNKSSSTTTKNDSKSSDNKMKTLYLSSGMILFDSDKLSYDVEVPNKVSSIKVSGDTSSDKAKVKGLGDTKLKVGLNVIKVVVTAENGEEKTYTLNITRREKSEDAKLDSNNYLKDLSIEGYEIDFDKEQQEYEINRNGKSSLNIKAITESKKAEVAIIGNEELKDKDEIKIVVTAESGDNRTYTITVVDESNILTAIGIFIIGVLSVAVATLYKKRRSIVEY